MKPGNLLVLAGGFGTRLSSAVSDVPKPLAPVMNRPFLQYLIEKWIEQGVHQFTFLLHHKACLISTFLQSIQTKGYLNGCQISIIIEPHPLGTGGAVAYAVREFQITGPFLIANSDTWLGDGIEQVAAARTPALAVLEVANSGRYGGVQTESGRVLSFEEKKDFFGSGWINAGLYHLHADLFRDWDGQPFSLEREVLPRLADSGELSAISLQTEFIDIGIPEDYFRFCRWIESGKIGAL
jgi:D-glycero-alpha-D-manno-heptose 1-phosphate guanylyltransferase